MELLQIVHSLLRIPCVCGMLILCSAFRIKIAKGVIAKVSYTALNMRVEACSAIKSTQKKYLRKFQDFVLSPIHKDVTCVFVTCVFATAC